MFKNNKKGILFLIPLLFSTTGIILIALLGLLFFGTAFFLTFNLFKLLGAFLIIMAALMGFKGLINQFTIALFIIGIMLLALPFLSDNLSKISLAAILQ